jgi:hypothetical protein
MDVVDAVAGVVTAVHHEAEAALAEAQLAREVARLPNHHPEEPVVVGRDVEEARDVAARDHEDVGGRLGPEVVEGDQLVVGVDGACGAPSLGDLAEDAGHRLSQVYIGPAGTSRVPARLHS